MFAIYRLWVDPSENRDAYGYELIGKVETKEEAIKICDMEYIPKDRYPWPLQYAYEFTTDTVPRFISQEIKDLSGLPLQELKNIRAGLKESRNESDK